MNLTSKLVFSSVQSLSHIWLFVTPWIAAHQASVHHQLAEFTETHVHRVSDDIQPSHPLSSPSPPVPKSSQHQGLFQWVNSSREVVKVLSFSFSISPSNEYSGLISFRMVGSPCSPRDFQESSSTPQFKSINSSALSLLHSPTLTSIQRPQEKP